MMTTNPCNYYSQYAETAQISGKTIADSANMVNYVAHKANSEKTANFWLRKEM